MRIAFLGGVPAPLGGGGLERQIARTQAALVARGHEVLRLEAAEAGAAWDVLHAFGAEGNVQFALQHWSRARSPLVLSPVLVASPGPQEWALRSLARAPVATYERERRRVLRRADALVALTSYEAKLLGALAGRGRRVEVVPNGVEVVEPAGQAPAPPGYALLLGAVSPRKRQAEVAGALAGAGPVVIVGPWAGPPDARRQFEAAVAGAGATWLGEVEDPRRVARLQRDAAALVQFTRAEGQSLAVLETLAQGTPVVLSDLPSHRELAAAHPGWARLAPSLAALPSLVAAARDAPPAAPPPRLPSWDDVAARLEAIYASLL